MRTADIPNSNYYIREDGKVFRKSDNKEVIPKNDYLYVNINKKKCYIHRLVAEAFVDKENDSYNIVDHINQNHLDNRAENLRWTDHFGNANNMCNNVPERQANRKAYDLAYSRQYHKERREHYNEIQKQHRERKKAKDKP